VDLLQKIEELRQRLEEIGIKKGFQSPEAIEISQQLDRLINKYYGNNRNKVCSKKAG